MDTSLYHQYVGDTPHHHRVRPVVVGAPYVLCTFALGIILMAVGTFITSHAYDDKNRDPVLLGVGPGLLGLGGLLLLSAVVICVVACLRNRKLREVLSDDFFTIGASTFYGGNEFVHLNDENEMGTYSSRHHRRRLSISGGVTDSNEGVMILASTVAEERERQRKNSRKFARNPSHKSVSQACYMGPQGLAQDRLSREDPDYLGLDPIRRAELLPELAQDYGQSESDDSRYIPRDRSTSMSVRLPRSHLTPVEQRLHRNLSYTPASRVRLQQQLQRQRQQAGLRDQGWEVQQSEPRRKRSSKRKAQAIINEVAEGPTVHQLPKYDPDLLAALGLGPSQPRLNRGMSEDGHLVSEAARSTDWRDNPDVTHGSLGNTRRRPSVVMGVKGLRPKQSGTAYRHTSSIYASDMELHRTDATVTSDTSQAVQEFRDFQAQVGNAQYLSPPESSMTNRSLGSSPTLLPPYDYEDTLPQPETRRENTPISTPSHKHRRRPLSNISSASESCCSECCGSHQQSMNGVPSEQELPIRPPNQEEDQSTDQEREDSDA